MKNYTTDTGVSALTGLGGFATFTLPQGSYRFKVEQNGQAAWSDTQSACAVPGCNISVATAGAKIVYEYDPLGRLTKAAYPGGAYYQYEYDRTGNRKTETVSDGVNTPVTTTSTYDDANRLTQAGSQTYTWDTSGNLLNDGVRTYAYNTANRLTSVTQGTDVTTYYYNGMGDRVKQIVNGQAMQYTLDMNAGLTQVLDDGTNSYLYGNDRIAQVNATDTQYFLGDALDSVRQMTDDTGMVGLAKDYAPYGSVKSSSGTASSPYGYTGEMADSTGLVYLRARYYAAALGRFMSRDIWVGDYNRPGTLNRWAYVHGNPINFTDPSGYIEEGKEAEYAQNILGALRRMGVIIDKDWGDLYDSARAKYNIKLKCGWNKGVWTYDELYLIKTAAEDLTSTVNGYRTQNGLSNLLDRVIPSMVGQARVKKVPGGWFGGMAPPGILSSYADILMQDLPDGREAWYKHTFVHEMGHVWDYRSGSQLSHNMTKAVGSWVCGVGDIMFAERCYWDPYQTKELPPDTIVECGNLGLDQCKVIPYSATFGNGGPLFTAPGSEDWANTLGYYVYPSYKEDTDRNQVIQVRRIRAEYVKQQFEKLH